MATLHVRNVPDEIYEALREAAEANGRSIGAEAIVRLSGGLRGHMAVPALPGRIRRRGRLDAFGADTRAVIADAEPIARELGHDHVRTEHLLLALTADERGYVRGVLRSRELSVETLRERIVDEAPPDDTAPEGPLPFGADAKEALELALRESFRSYTRWVAPMHLFFGVLRADGLASRVLTAAGLEERALREEPFLLARNLHARSVGDDLRVVELDGETAEWERRLNDAADDGYELVQIVERRAIFRRR